MHSGVKLLVRGAPEHHPANNPVTLTPFWEYSLSLQELTKAAVPYDSAC